MKYEEKKPIFLLSRSVVIPNRIFPANHANSTYEERDYKDFISTVRLGTQSKTFAAPGDDDPDREAEFCF